MGDAGLTRVQNIGMHLVGVMACSGLYLGWAAIGKRLTGEFPFFWLDEAEVGSKEAVTLYCMGFALLSQLSKFLLERGGVCNPGRT